jgi:hypothetical protein
LTGHKQRNRNIYTETETYVRNRNIREKVRILKRDIERDSRKTASHSLFGEEKFVCDFLTDRCTL